MTQGIRDPVSKRKKCQQIDFAYQVPFSATVTNFMHFVLFFILNMYNKTNKQFFDPVLLIFTDTSH